MKSARQAVVESLCHMEKTDAWSSLALDSSLNSADLSQQDRGFASALFYGTIARKYTIDICIAPLSNKPLEKLDSVVLNILRIAFFQLLYMDSVPDHAAVSESVNLSRKMKKSSASGFVNAVVRGFLRTNKAVPIKKNASLLERLSVEYSCPEELVGMWLEAYGEENTREILENSLMAPPVFIRVNTTKTTAEKLLETLSSKGLEISKHSNVENCLVLDQPYPMHTMPEYTDGLFHMQDISSQMAALSLNIKEGERVLDCCAAPGGKAFVIAQELAGTGEVVACDIYKHRVEEIENRNIRLGLKNIKTMVLDMSVYHEELGSFDKVICDAPCSGLGTIRRRPEIKYSGIDRINSLVEIQRTLLENASKYCKNDGLLVYSTCTLSPKENDSIVEDFLDNHPDFAPAQAENLHGKNWKNTILLGDNGADGFFIACMQKRKVQ